MKRVVTVCFSLIFLAGLSQSLSAQLISHGTSRPSKAPSAHAAVSSAPAKSAKGNGLPGASGILPAAKGSSPLAALTSESASYFQDTTGDNWWVYTPVFSAGEDSLNYFTYGSKLYVFISDSIGPIQVGLSSTQDTTPFDTTYYRVMGMRISTPTDFKPNTVRNIDSIAITLFPIAISPNDSIVFHIVPIEDVAFTKGGQPIGDFPIPDLFASTLGNKYIASGAIKASDLVVGDLNTVSVSFVSGTKGKSLGTRTQFGVVMYVDGPDFVNDTIGYVLDANAQTPPTTLDIDTDGSLSTIVGADGNPVEMRTYRGSLDGGHMILGGNAGPSLVGGIGQFFVGYGQFDPESMQSTGQAFYGNLVMTTYMSGTLTNGVDEPLTHTNQLNQNYPNPVAGKTEISYELQSNGPVSIKLYNALGNEVANLVEAEQGAGKHSLNFNAGALPDGTYFYTLRCGENSITRMMSVQH